uniref:Mitochondrial import receptor subunit TOM40 homolog n=1 Tax=Panagrolaimus superbus TaxID=310955 RepID=A0A914XSH0_9BILA
MSEPPPSVKPTAEALTPSLQPPVNQNPGAYEELHRKCRDVFPMCFEGAKLMVQKGLSSQFQITHTLSISTANTGYRFGATYIGTQDYPGGETFPVLLADTDGSGNTSATILHQFAEKYRVKLQGQVQQGKLAAAQGTFERRGRLSTYGIMLGNTDLINQSGIVVGHLLRRITERLDLGAELVYQYDKRSGQHSALSYAARYTAPNWTLSSTLGTAGVQVLYHHKQHDGLQFGIEFDANLRQAECVTTFAYQAELPESAVTVRASCDTNWTVGAVFEKRLSPTLPFTLAISGLLNHLKGQGKFGVGLIIGA